jgi:hypothetical protein
VTQQAGLVAGIPGVRRIWRDECIGLRLLGGESSPERPNSDGLGNVDACSTALRSKLERGGNRVLVAKLAMIAA